jgi:hypothetical protein
MGASKGAITLLSEELVTFGPEPCQYIDYVFKTRFKASIADSSESDLQSRNDWLILAPPPKTN